MDLTGVFAPLPTPFDGDDHVDTVRLGAALARWVASPLSGFVVLGTNGEIGLLTDDECDQVVDTARAAVPRGRPLIAGAGRESTRATIAAARRAASLGADAVLVRTPSFFRSEMTHDNLVRYYTSVADASPAPVLLYTFAAATGVNLLPATAAHLAEHANIIGIKDSGTDIAQISELAAIAPRRFRVLAGSASIFFSAVAAGCAGGILAVATLLPDACVRIFELVRAKRFDEALAVHRRLLPVSRLLGRYGVPGLKAALALAGVEVGGPRPPLAPLSHEAIAEVQAALAAFEEVTA